MRTISDLLEIYSDNPTEGLVSKDLAIECYSEIIAGSNISLVDFGSDLLGEWGATAYRYRETDKITLSVHSPDDMKYSGIRFDTWLEASVFYKKCVSGKISVEELMSCAEEHYRIKR